MKSFRLVLSGRDYYSACEMSTGLDNPVTYGPHYEHSCVSISNIGNTRVTVAGATFTNTKGYRYGTSTDMNIFHTMSSNCAVLKTCRSMYYRPSERYTSNSGATHVTTWCGQFQEGNSHFKVLKIQNMLNNKYYYYTISFYSITMNSTILVIDDNDFVYLWPDRQKAPSDLEYRFYQCMVNMDRNVVLTRNEGYENIKLNADTIMYYFNTFKSSSSYYNEVKSIYDNIESAYNWIPTRDQAYTNLINITTPTNTSDTSTTNTAKENASSYWSTLNSKDISEWSNYNTAKAKYDAIVAIHTNNTERDSAYNSLTSLANPSTNTVQASAKATKDNATTHWNTIKAKTTSEWSNYNTAKAKYDAIVAGHAATVTRDTRLTKKADKTELNTSNSKLTFNQAAVHAKGRSDYTSINSTLSSVNNKLK